jgi:hypothetical protein
MSGKPPWWQTTKTVRQGLLLGGGSFVLGLGELVCGVTGTASAWRLILAAGLLAIGMAHLGSAAAMRKRQRSGLAQGGHPASRDPAPPAF